MMDKYLRIVPENPEGTTRSSDFVLAWASAAELQTKVVNIGDSQELAVKNSPACTGIELK